ncbi:MAG: ATP-grasp domain-containing protein [Deltaproteobacteria bacterium]
MSRSVVIVGTTPDYVVKLYERYSISLLFLTDTRFQNHPLLKRLPSSALIFAPLEKAAEACRSMHAFLAKAGISPHGIGCFDCDSLLLASRLGKELGLRFPGWEAIARCRSKFESKKTWINAGVASPAAAVVSSLPETMDFFRSHGKSVVLKPLAGSGSELLFHCNDAPDVTKAVTILGEELPRRKSNPLFRPCPSPAGDCLVDPCACWVVEEFISGPEFSCDFVLQDGEVSFIRETGKIKAADKPFGSVLAYTFPPRHPAGFEKGVLKEALKKAATSLGFDWGFFMVDYILKDGTPVFIEMTPRPGGDSIPELVSAAAGLDTLALYLDFVQGHFKEPEKLSLPPESFASLNFYAPKEGTVQVLDGSKVAAHAHVKKLFFKKQKGDRVILPPRDYDNRLLGYCIIEANPGLNLVAETRRLQQLLDVGIEENA